MDCRGLECAERVFINLKKEPMIAAPLLAWFDVNKRILPFRTLSTPYRVWVSEIMLQQTRVSTALPYFERFVEKLPTVESLALCGEDELFKLWEGLGYYSRVHNMQKAARVMITEHGGELPADFDALKALPGIGDYTAGAIASICFHLPITAVDGNVLRVFARLLNDDGDVLAPEAKKRLTAQVKACQSAERPGDFNEALMELGALICVPNGAPHCDDCPLSQLCAACAIGNQADLPVKKPLRKRRCEKLSVVVVLCENRILLEKRPKSGLLAGMWQPLVLDGHLNAEQICAELADREVFVREICEGDASTHIFTHLEWHMRNVICRDDAAALPPHCVFASSEELREIYAVPSAFAGAMNLLKKHL